MLLTLTRTWPTDTATLGLLAVDGLQHCCTLEPPGPAAIPAGTYRLLITKSLRFRRDLPLIVDVPGRTAIRIHAGNTVADTSGCVLVGSALDREAARISQSQLALDGLMRILRPPLAAGEACWIVVRDIPQPDSVDVPNALAIAGGAS